MRALTFLLTLVIYSSVLTAQKADIKDNLMPLPNSIELNGGGFFVLNEDFSLRLNNFKSESLAKYSDRVYRRISDQTGLFFRQDYLTVENNPEKAQLLIDVEGKGQLGFEGDESYSLSINEDRVLVKAKTEFGAYHALETLQQLLSVDNGRYVFPMLEIKDSPRFKWRGLMLDVSRHFLPVGTIKRQIDLMSAVKLNVLHWHLSDDQGFRVEIESRPELHLKGSDGNYYTKAQIRDIVKYAGDRGIRVIPEIDIPGHATAILAAMPQLASKDTVYTIERNAGIFLPVIDPTNPLVYEVFDDVFREMAELFPDKYFHIGGDENEGKNWESNPEIMAFFEKIDIHHPNDIQAYFNNKLYKILKKYGKEMMGWEEIQNDAIPKSAVIHAWRGDNEGEKSKSSLVKAVKNGHNVVLSNGFYIDLMKPASSHYQNSIITPEFGLTKEEEKMVLGGEATMWAELITPLTIDGRIWPRTAAIAEKMWTNLDKTQDVDFMYKRLDVISNHLERLGSQHRINQDVLIRNLSDYSNYHAVKLLVDVCEPMKIYTRNPGGTINKTFTPYTKFADACVADAKGAREFNELVKQYTSTNSINAEKELISIFNSWVDNDEKFKKVVANSPILSEVEKKSEYLKELGELGITILEKKKVSKKKLKKYLERIEEIKADEGGRTELMICTPMEKLLNNFSLN